MKSAYKLGWIGMRVNKLGKAAKWLKSKGWMQWDPAGQNNRNGWNWVCPVVSQEKFSKMDWRTPANMGLEAIAIWVTDAQWGYMRGMTEKQWRERAFIDQAFNAKWPTGRRN